MSCCVCGADGGVCLFVCGSCVLCLCCRRIAFCLDVHNEAVKSMRYPSEEDYKKELSKKKGDESKDKDTEKTIEELIKEMEEDYDE